MTPLEEIQELKRRIAKLEQSLSQQKKWEPKGGDYRILSTGDVSWDKSCSSNRLFGTERSTRELAERAAYC